MDPKKLATFKKTIESDDTDGVSVYPDIIVHQRGASDNFIVIEAKKTTNTDDSDMEKLKAYKADLAYTHTFFVRFPVGKDFSHFDEASLADYIKEIS
ncbi:MAG: hypothetical protein ABIG34_05005 [Candidatus Peregrinibacteria bacterium]